MIPRIRVYSLCRYGHGHARTLAVAVAPGILPLLHPIHLNLQLHSHSSIHSRSRNSLLLNNNNYNNNNSYGKWNTQLNSQLITDTKYGKAVFTTSTSKQHEQPNTISISQQQLQPPLPSFIPPRLAPYYYLARYDKPIGTYLLFLPCTWSIAMATYANPTITLPTMLHMMTLFALGSYIMRGAGCTINDLWDQDLDKRVTRTASRPIASGTLSTSQGLTFLGLQLSAGLLILLQLNTPSIILGASSLGLVILYPLMKRITWWPQLILGLTFNWGALLGYAAMVGFDMNLFVTIPLYLSGVAWTLVYDTIYALQDMKDDIKTRIRSTAIYFSNSKLGLKPWLTVFTCLMGICLGIAGWMNEQLLFYYAGVVGAMGHLGWQIWTLKPADVNGAWERFKSNRWVGVMVLGGVLGDMVYKRYFYNNEDRMYIEEKKDKEVVN